MTNKFRVRDTVKNIVFNACYYLNQDGVLCYINSDWTFDKPFLSPVITPEHFTGFSDKNGDEIWQHDKISIPFNKQDREFSKRDSYILEVDWDEDYGAWLTYEMVGDTRMKHTPLYKMAKKATIVKEVL